MATEVLDIVMRLVAAGFLGACIGFERRMHHKAIGTAIGPCLRMGGTASQGFRAVRLLELVEAKGRPAIGAADAWAEELRTVPELTETTFHLITGLLLPIWNRSAARPTLRRSVAWRLTKANASSGGSSLPRRWPRYEIRGRRSSSGRPPRFTSRPA